ncbi:MAG: hypothetical protein ACYTEZ_19665 [Planctomycetota bacterium]
MTSSVRAGSVTLAGPRGDVTLVWNGETKERARALPPGVYRVRTTRVERTKDGTHWFISSTSPPRAPVAVRAGKTTHVRVGDTVHFESRVRRHGNELRLGFAIKGADGRGLSVYKDGRRVPVTFNVLSKKGRVLASGTMNYG